MISYIGSAYIYWIVITAECNICVDKAEDPRYGLYRKHGTVLYSTVPSNRNDDN